MNGRSCARGSPDSRDPPVRSESLDADRMMTKPLVVGALAVVTLALVSLACGKPEPRPVTPVQPVASSTQGASTEVYGQDFIVTVNVAFGEMTATGRMQRTEKAYEAVVVKTDVVRDLAIIKLKDPPPKLEVAKFAKSADLDRETLTKDRRFFPPYDAVLLHRADALSGARPRLGRLAGSIDAGKRSSSVAWPAPRLPFAPSETWRTRASAPSEISLVVIVGCPTVQPRVQLDRLQGPAQPETMNEVESTSTPERSARITRSS